MGSRLHNSYSEIKTDLDIEKVFYITELDLLLLVAKDESTQNKYNLYWMNMNTGKYVPSEELSKDIKYKQPLVKSIDEPKYSKV